MHAQSGTAAAGSAKRPPAESLAALASSLGDLQPARAQDDIEVEHIDRLAVLVAAAPRMRVTCPADAALALSVVARCISDMREHALSPSECYDRIDKAMMVLGRLGAWMAEDLASPPLRTVWPHYASPFIAFAAPLAGGSAR